MLSQFGQAAFFLGFTAPKGANCENLPPQHTHTTASPRYENRRKLSNLWRKAFRHLIGINFL